MRTCRNIFSGRTIKYRGLTVLPIDADSHSGSSALHSPWLTISLRAAQHKRDVCSSTPSFNHATTGDRGEILIQPSPDSRLERARQVNLCAAIVAERGDVDYSD